VAPGETLASQIEPHAAAERHYANGDADRSMSSERSRRSASASFAQPPSDKDFSSLKR
jgi:hypothetical protein